MRWKVRGIEDAQNDITLDVLIWAVDLSLKGVEGWDSFTLFSPVLVSWERIHSYYIYGVTNRKFTISLVIIT